MVITIRQMTLEDMEQVHVIDVMSFSMPWTIRSFRFELTENTNSRLYVAEVREGDAPPRLAGMIVMWMILDEAHIGTIAVHPDYRRMGIGRKLLAEALLTAAREKAKQAFLEVRRSNTAALGLYISFGFEVVGMRPRYYSDNHEDALLMTLFHLDPQALERLQVG